MSATNAVPTSEMSDPLAPPASTEDLYLANERQVRMMLLLHGIDHISCSFSGSGDSGDIDGLEFFSGKEVVNASKIFLDVWPEPHREFYSDRGWVYTLPTEKVATDLHEAVMQLIDHDLENCSVDWYNNEGGNGSWEWRPDTGVQFDVYYNVVESHHGYGHNRELGKDK